MEDAKTQAAKRVFHVAKLVKGDAEFAFDLRRREDGGLGISNVKIAPSDAERTLIYTHFGSPARVRGGGEKNGRMIETIVTYQPGTPEHFLAAVHALPPPYVLVARPEA